MKMNEEITMQDFETRPEFTQKSSSDSAPPLHNMMETAAFILGIVALLSVIFVPISVTLAALGILLALLSRGGNFRTAAKAKIALIICTLSLFLSAVMSVSLFHSIKDIMKTEEFKELFEDYYEYYYDDDIDEEDIEDFLEDFL